ncbi:hypothetical protein KB1_24560 [Cutibacterium modestum]|uniref:Uncharacterized protein n=1 Tax=Cutibacterium modestum TaxID=2559073 RepID=A0AAD1NX93_9ACTN|nr:hypothetical protein KB1_24560 [Cutibacterium modestum]
MTSISVTLRSLIPARYNAALPVKTALGRHNLTARTNGAYPRLWVPGGGSSHDNSGQGSDDMALSRRTPRLPSDSSH